MTLDLLLKKKHDGFKVYDGSGTFSSDLLYTVKANGKGFKVYDEDSVTDLVYTIEATEDGYKVYKGNSTFFSDLKYTIRKK